MKTLFIAPGSPWENGYNKSSNGTLRQELLRREIFYSLEEARMLIGQWRLEYNTVRPHSSVGYLPPAPEAIRPDPEIESMRAAPAVPVPAGDSRVAAEGRAQGVRRRRPGPC